MLMDSTVKDMIQAVLNKLMTHLCYWYLTEENVTHCLVRTISDGDWREKHSKFTLKVYQYSENFRQQLGKPTELILRDT